MNDSILSQKDSLLKQSIEEKIENPLLENSEVPIRDISNPARNKQSVMKVKVPISHDKFKTTIKPKNQEIIEYAPEDSKSYYKNKPLHEFDCYDDDKDPLEWLEICQNMNSIAHAHTPIYENYD